MTAQTLRPDLVDEMGEDSFPASDPPAVWTWDALPAAAAPVVEPARPARRRHGGD